MIDLIYDTETTGFPLWKAPVSDSRQPYLVQLAVVLAKGDELILTWDRIVKCPIEIPEAASNVHGITTGQSQRHGHELESVMKEFDQMLASADRVICHNTSFDMIIMSYAYYRAGMNMESLEKLPSICTMKTATPVLKLPSKRGYKWPKMIEAYKALVDPAGFDAAHTADADAMACWKVLLALEKRGVELL